MAVFLSYHNSRLETVEHVANYLSRHQIDAWYAPRDIPPGAMWDEAIAKAIRDSDALVLLFDSSADTSRHVKREVALADNHDIPIRWLRLEDVEPDKLSYYLNTTQWIDWLDKRDEALSRLVRSLSSQDRSAVAPAAAAPQTFTPAADPRPTVRGGEDKADLTSCGTDEERRRGRLRAVLTEATGLATEHDPDGAIVMFPDGRVISMQRASLLVHGQQVWLGMWPCELAPQYKRVYGDEKMVEALIDLGAQPNWEVNANFHLAFRFARLNQRWYPRRHLSGPQYVRQWMDDLRANRAGGRTNEQLRDPEFRRWLVDRGYAIDREMPSLDQWLDERPPGTQLHIRPSVEIRRNWSLAEATALDATGEFAAQVRDAIGRALGALREPNLESLGR